MMSEQAYGRVWQHDSISAERPIWCAQPWGQQPPRTQPPCLASSPHSPALQRGTSYGQAWNTSTLRPSTPISLDALVVPDALSLPRAPPALSQPQSEMLSTRPLSQPAWFAPPPGLAAAPPPGLEFQSPVRCGAAKTRSGKKRPPGLELLDSDDSSPLPTPSTVAPPTPAESLCSGLSEPPSLSSTPARSEATESVSVGLASDADAAYIRAEWCVVNFTARMKAGIGKPLVSPPFSAAGYEDLRLMVFPDPKGAIGGGNAKKRQSNFVKMVSKGPLQCALRLKATSGEGVLCFQLTVGDRRWGPFTCDLSQQSICGVMCEGDLDIDWLGEVGADGCVCAGLEILDCSR